MRVLHRTGLLAGLSLFAVCGSYQAPAVVTVFGAVDGVRLVGAETYVQRGRAVRFEGVAAGDWTLHFAATSAGKPASLPLSLRDGDEAVVVVPATTAGAADDATTLAVHSLREFAVVPADAAALWSEADGGLRKVTATAAPPAFTALVAGPAERRSQRVDADVAPGATGVVGVVLCWQDADNHYRGVWDRDAHEVRFERLLAGRLFVLGRHAVAVDDGAPHHLTAQSDGFRVALWFDDMPMVQTLDGAHTHGRAGLWATLESEASFRGCRVGTPVQPCGVAAAVRRAGPDDVAVHIAAMAPQQVGADYWLSLSRVPRPGPRLLDEKGQEPFLLLGEGDLVLPLGASWGGRWRSVHGSVGPDGGIAAELRWPTRLGCRGRSVQLRLDLVSADGEQRLAQLPPVWVAL